MGFKPEDVRIPWDEYTKYDNVPKEKTDPSYYKRWKIEPLEFCLANDLPFWLGSILKYCMRYDQKDGLQDLYKARVYLDKKIQELEKR
jgi:hypothetical protein